MAIPPKWYQFLVGVFASLGSVLYGYDLGVIAGVIAAPSFLSYFDNPSDAETGAIVSVFTGGAFFGAMFAGPTGDWLGRKRTILTGAIIFCLGGALQTGAQSVNYLYAGRVIAGLGVGFLVMIVPLYQAEIAHPSIRGRVTSLQQFMLGIGSLVASWTTFGTNSNLAATSEVQWRVPLAIQIIPAFILALLILLFPESPRWLIDHNREHEGLKTLARLHAHGNENDTWVRAEFDQIKEMIAYEHAHEAKGYIELFTNRSSFRRLFLVTALQASVQMTGVSSIQYFAPAIYEQIGIGTTDSLKYQAISSVLALLAQLACMLFIDHTGRRWPLILGNLGNCLMFVIATILLGVFPPTATAVNHAAGWGFIVVTWLYNISFSATCGPLSWIIPAEVFDTRTRSKGVSIGVMVSFAFNTMIGQVTPIAIGEIGYRWYIVFAVSLSPSIFLPFSLHHPTLSLYNGRVADKTQVCNFTNAIFFYLLLPETAQRPLEEMNKLFSTAPLLVPRMRKEDFVTHDLERRVEEKEQGYSGTPDEHEVETVGQSFVKGAI